MAHKYFGRKNKASGKSLSFLAWTVYAGWMSPEKLHITADFIFMSRSIHKCRLFIFVWGHSCWHTAIRKLLMSYPLYKDCFYFSKVVRFLFNLPDTCLYLMFPQLTHHVGIRLEFSHFPSFLSTQMLKTDGNLHLGPAAISWLHFRATKIL